MLRAIEIVWHSKKLGSGLVALLVITTLFGLDSEERSSILTVRPKPISWNSFHAPEECALRYQRPRYCNE
jgi:hypothetical protein